MCRLSDLLILYKFETIDSRGRATPIPEADMATHPQHDNPDTPGEAEEDGRIYIGSAELRERLSELLSMVKFQDQRFIVERHGKPVAAVVPVEDLDSLEALEDEADRETLRQLDDDAEAVPLDEMEGEAFDDD